MPAHPDCGEQDGDINPPPGWADLSPLSHGLAYCVHRFAIYYDYPPTRIVSSSSVPAPVALLPGSFAPRRPIRKPYDNVSHIPVTQVESTSFYHPPPTPSPAPRDNTPTYMHSFHDCSSAPVPPSHQFPIPQISTLPDPMTRPPTRPASLSSPRSIHPPPHASPSRTSASHAIPTPLLLRRTPLSSSHTPVLPTTFVRLNTPLAAQPQYPPNLPNLPPPPSPSNHPRTPLFYPSPHSSAYSRISSRTTSSTSRSVPSRAPSITRSPVPQPSPVPRSLVPSPTPSLSYTFTETKLPTTTHITLLSRADDWPDWYSGVQGTIEHTGLWAFVAPDPLPGAYPDPASVPTFPPFIDFAVHLVGSPELEAYQAWWRLDDVVSHVITSRLGPIPRRLIPLEKRDAYGHRISTSRSLLQILREKYGVGNAAAADLIKTQTLSRKANSMAGIAPYVTSWQQAFMQTQNTRWPFSYCEQVQKFIDGLPPLSAFDGLRAEVRADIDRPESDRTLSFDFLANEVLKIDMDLRRLAIAHPASRRPQPAASLATTALPSASTTASSPNSTPTSSDRPICDNCGSYGHLAPNCWKPGGGDEGGKDRFLAQKAANRPTALVTTTSDTARPLLPIVETAEETAIDLIDLYTECYPEPLPTTVESPSLPPYTDFVYATDSTALLSFSSRFNSILDSGCTVHIIRDREFFWSYDPSQAVTVGTANCGVLQTLGKGEVRFKTILNDKEVIYRLRECLHAPSAPINLLSVGCMTELGTRLSFEQNSTTIHFPASTTRSSGHVLDATVIRRLSFLSCNFIRPPSSCPSLDLADAVVLPAVALQGTDLRFPHVVASPDLWHRRLGHLGSDATRAVLTKPYATDRGKDYAASIRLRDENLACLRANHATRVLPDSAHSGVATALHSAAAMKDFISLLSTDAFTSVPSDFTSLESDALADFKAYSTYPESLRWKSIRPFNPDEPPASFAEAISCPDADVC
ncbi:hypothetical protein D9615_005653 [Tricholomella constricta]|uniref:CCHC-type domain-containing protein n=1 Tax=Tricholomella constricta TaxID=117010 RepID=A0A8H5HAJ5_9AGAR|nr:hypothetical protein D9615_005653 [Tricholomella constricta]